jgi:hypothetical protein
MRLSPSPWPAPGSVDHLPALGEHLGLSCDRGWVAADVGVDVDVGVALLELLGLGADRGDDLGVGDLGICCISGS